MAPRRARPLRRPWGAWLLVPLALVLDAVSAARFEGRPLPHGVAVSEGVLILAAIVVYGGLALFAFRRRPLASRLAIAAFLLGLHAGLVAVHTLAYMIAWSFSFRVALRLAHRWSPFLPLLQLLWVPLLALPFLISPRPRRRKKATPQKTPTRIPIEVLLTRASRVRAHTDRVDAVEPSGSALLSVAPPPSA